MRLRVTILPAVLLSLILAACSGAPQAAPTESAQEPSAPHDEGPPHWTYEGEEGPDHWGELSSEYALCGTGETQSPIDIAAAAPGERPDIVFNYSPSALTILNNGHTVQVNYDAGSTAVIDGTTYDLLQFHFHTPSEHTVNGEGYAGEMHLVHRDANGKLAVVGVFIQEGAENPAFDVVIANAPTEKADPAAISGATVDMNALTPEVTTTYRYSGSLTTPPCSEGVSWNLVTTPIEMSREQIAALHDIMHNNNRPARDANAGEVIEDSQD